MLFIYFFHYLAIHCPICEINWCPSWITTYLTPTHSCLVKLTSSQHTLHRLHQSYIASLFSLLTCGPGGRLTFEAPCTYIQYFSSHRYFHVLPSSFLVCALKVLLFYLAELTYKLSKRNMSKHCRSKHIQVLAYKHDHFRICHSPEDTEWTLLYVWPGSNIMIQRVKLILKIKTVFVGRWEFVMVVQVSSWLLV